MDNDQKCVDALNSLYLKYNASTVSDKIKAITTELGVKLGYHIWDPFHKGITKNDQLDLVLSALEDNYLDFTGIKPMKFV